MRRGYSVSARRYIVIIGLLILCVTAGLCGCTPTQKQQDEIIVPIVICTPESPLVNVYKATPQPWANKIFEFAFPLFPTPIPPNSAIQFNEQSILDARYTAFQQLIKETKRWSDTQVLNLNDSSDARVTVTYLSPELLQAVILNQVLRDRSLTYGFQDQLQKVLNTVAERNELLFLLTVAMKNSNMAPTRHTIRIPIQGMVMHNAENLTITHSHDDHNLEKVIDTSSDPVFGYLAYPLAQVSSNQCKWILDPKYNTNIVVTVPYVEVDGTSNATPLFWTIPYMSLINPIMPSDTYIWTLPPTYDQSQMAPFAEPPTDINQPTYWQDFARFIWSQITLGNY
jgi:hypothetical protein